MRISNRMTERELTVMKAIWDIGDGATTAKIVKKLTAATGGEVRS